MKTKHSLLTAGMTALFFTVLTNTAPADIQFDTEILSMNLSGGPFPMPLATDPTNLLGDSVDGFGFVDSQVTITASSQRNISPGPQSLGSACGINSQTCPPAPAIDPSALHGTSYLVDSRFDVFFDIVLTDVDSRSGRNYAGQADGASLVFQDVQTANMQSFSSGAVFDQNEESFDLLMPPQPDFYVGFPVDILLGADINSNGTNDKLSFSLLQYGVQSGNRVDQTLITNLLWRHAYDAAGKLEGVIKDVTGTGGVPFAIGAQLPNGQPDPAAFGGRDLVESRLVNPLIPEPSTLLLSLSGLVTLGRKRRW
ncbi:MAG: PEP-CTERM sorting domain-containing protein [Pirellulales bacterium]|nr:PEP-CTERM sorting domain-containing protein [Pirellulales bacterium]